MAVTNLLTGVAIRDLDQDGKPDLIVTGALVSVFRNISTLGSITIGSFAAKVDVGTGGNSAFGVAIGDIDGDNKPDMVVTDEGAGTVTIFRNTSTPGPVPISFGSNEIFTTGDQPRGVAIGDLDGDGKSDIIVTNIASSSISIFRNTSTVGSITALKQDFTTNSTPYYSAIGDIDGDGKPDVVVANFGTDNVSVFKKVSTSGTINASSFSAKVDFTTGTQPLGLAIGDIDGDGKPEVVVTNVAVDAVSIFRNAINDGAFITTWQTTTASESITIPTFTGETYNYTVDWGDGTIESGFTGDATHVYAAAGTYSVAITGTFPRIYFNGGGEGQQLDKIVSMDQWGSISWSSFENMFWGCSNLVSNASDAPDLSNVTSARSMFNGTSINTISSNWDVTNILNFQDMFLNSAFNYDISGWDVGNATNMQGMFANSPFNQPIGNWDVSSVINMAYMFWGASSFNQPLNNWDVSSVQNFTGTFWSNTGFNQPLNQWDMSVAGTLFEMFREASEFDQDLSSWDISFVTDMTNMLDNSGMSSTNYDNTLIGWAALDVLETQIPSSITLGATGLTYCAGETARNTLINSHSWNISGDSKLCSGLVPSITSVTPASGPIGTEVTISGSNFDETPANNIVWFGATKANVKSATATSLIVTVPMGATYNAISVLVNGLLVYSPAPFIVTFLGGGIIDSNSFESKIDLISGSGAQSISIGDLDGDGKADLVAANYFSNSVSIFRNISVLESGISFDNKVDYSSQTHPRSVALGDLDGDGRVDLVVANEETSKISVFRNTSASGSISLAASVDYSTGLFPQSVSINDFDGDGKADIVVANGGNSTVSILRNISTSIGIIAFDPKVDLTSGGPSSVATSDLDGDGKVDLVVANGSSNTVSVFRNTGIGDGIISYDSKIDYATDAQPFSVSIGDLDGDNKADLAVANYGSTTISVFRNSSSGPGIINYASQVKYSIGSSPTSVSIGDIDGDSKVDLVVTNGPSAVSVLKNSSSGPGVIDYLPKVDFAADSAPFFVSIGDLDSDGRPDLATANYSGNTISTVSIFKNIIGGISSLIAYYPFNSNTNDESGNGNHGIESGGITLTTDRFDGPDEAYTFDGIDDQITLPITTQALVNEFTVMAWAYRTKSHSTGHQGIVSSTVDSNDGGVSLGIRQNSFNLRSFFTNDLGTTYSTFGKIVPEGDWTFSVTTYDGSALKLFQNGELVSEVVASGNIAGLGNFLIGNNPFNGIEDEFFGGKIDEVRIYSNALTDFEILDTYVNEKPTFTGNDIVFYRLSQVPNVSEYTFLGQLVGKYYYISKTPALWNDARAAAEAQGWKLATVHSSVENTFIANRITENVWLGMTDQYDEGNFTWVDGTIIDYEG
ncbi:MAG: FG-GAP-like repeat-containing protein [Bacteroidetes bacterium]|nr:FG-GAP-like repeat-containing protein [Bacteroidota bacterium]